MAAHRRRFRRRLLFPHRRPRLFRDRSNPLETLEEDEVFERFRFHSQTIMYLIRLLPNLAHSIKRNNPLPSLIEILVCLRYLAIGAIHLLIGDSLNMHIKECCRPLHTWNRATHCESSCGADIRNFGKAIPVSAP